MNSLEEIAGCLKKRKKAVICGHESPDGDSIGSILAMQLILKQIGLESYVAVSDTIPAIYDFLPGVTETVSAEQIPADCDLAVVLDCTDLSRLGYDLAGLVTNVPMVVNIDHHISNQEFGGLNYVDAGAAATGEIVFKLIQRAGLELTKEIAVNLYTAIVMDTGSFRFDNTTDRTHEISAELIRLGINSAEINRFLFEQKEISQLRLMGYALSRLKTSAGGKLAWITIPYQVMSELGASDEQAGGIVNYPGMLKNVEIGVFFREISPGAFRVGFRSKERVDVNKLASRFGGGGHPRAAGCSLQGSLEEVENQVIDWCVQSLEETVPSDGAGG